MTKVEIFHNVHADSFFGLNAVLEPGGKREAVCDEELHPLVKVFEYELPDAGDDMAVAEDAFARFNDGSGREDAAYFARRLRSLSTGDVVKVDGQAYSCQSAGWAARCDAELNVITDPAEAEALVRARFQIPARERVLTITVPLPQPEPCALAECDCHLV